MEAVTTSMFVLLLISGLGLTGESYNTCKDTLINNGFSMSDSAYYEFYQSANDPDNILFINNNQDYLSEQWSSIQSESVPTTPPDYDHDNVESVPLYPPYADPLVAWYFEFLYNVGNETDDIVGDSLPDYAYTGSTDSYWVANSASESVTVWDEDLRADAYLQQYGKPVKTVTDGHGGYYQGVISKDGDNGVGYTIYHYDANGSVYTVYTDYTGSISWYSYYNYDYTVSENPDGSQTVLFVNTFIYDGQTKTNVLKTEKTVKFDTEKTEEIEEKKIGETTDVAINPDGSISLPDGSLVYPNSDGTYTIGGTDYSPSINLPDTSDINDLLKQLLDLQEQIKDLENSLQFEKDKADSFDVSESVDSAVGSYEGDLSEFLLNSRITQVFPFCLPFDFVRGLKLISSSPVPPKFDINFDIPSFGAYPGTHNLITLDLGVYSKYFNVVRWVSTVLFIISLCFLTHKLIKW